MSASSEPAALDLNHLDLDPIVNAIVAKVAERLRDDPEALLDRPALARRLGVGERTVSSMVARAELPPPLLHTGGIARWSWAQVTKYLTARQNRRIGGGRGRYRRTSKPPADTPANDREATAKNGQAEGMLNGAGR